MIDILQLTIESCAVRGFIKISSSIKESKQDLGVKKMVLDFDSSSFTLDSEESQEICKLEDETNFKRILDANVNFNFKIAKLICNELGWSIIFNSFNASRFSLVIPLPLTKRKSVSLSSFNP